MEPNALGRVLGRTRALIEGAKALGLPIACTEQYPKGLGPTEASIGALLQGVKPVEKMRFSAAIAPVLDTLEGRSQILVAGMEAHICVYQTARDLMELGNAPIVLTDAVISRTEEDRRVGLDLCAGAGVVLSTVESALFDMLGAADAPEFKRISKAVR
jgi:hypothetical protein